jgi:uncharacterized cupredoxin-like copper-binding protein
MKKLALCVFAVLLATALAAGCGSSSSSKKKKKKGSTTAAQTVTIKATAAGKGLKYDAPASVKGGLTKLTFTNSGKKPAAAQLIRVEGNQTAEEVQKAGDSWGEKGKPLPDWLKLEGGVRTTGPGETASATQNLAPGKYYVYDIESNANAPMEVTGRGEGGEPSAGPKIDAIEYSFQSTGLKQGKQTVLFDNKGKQPHFVVGGPLTPGTTIAEARKAFQSEEQSGPPPFDEKSAFTTAILDGGKKQAVDLDLKKKGKYAFICFIPDRQGGPPHVAKGMVSEATVE